MFDLLPEAHLRFAEGAASRVSRRTMSPFLSMTFVTLEGSASRLPSRIR
jgi:hypothetical protein